MALTSLFILFSAILAQIFGHKSYDSCHASNLRFYDSRSFPLGCYSMCVSGAQNDYEASGCGSICASTCAGEATDLLDEPLDYLHHDLVPNAFKNHLDSF